MGIVNVTPDSFSDGGETVTVDYAVGRALDQIEAGADIVDIGGESTRPGSKPVSLEDELHRVIPVITALAKKIDVPISIDTYKSEVAYQAIQAGASIVNDISAGTFSPEMSSVVAASKSGVILMHIKGTPRNMQSAPTYADVVHEVSDFLQLAKDKFLQSGVAIDNILIDPGIGFGKNLDHNLEVIRHLKEFQGIGAGIVYGPSRKSFIGLLTGKPIQNRLAGTIGSVIAGMFLGADVVRVHDVREAVDALKVAEAIRFHGGVVD
jgi:dihydropteroate synthase